VRAPGLHAYVVVTATEITTLLKDVGLPLILVLAITYVLTMPEKAQTVAGWFWSLVSSVTKRGDRKAVALRVQGHVNGSIKPLTRHTPDGIIEGKLKLRWSTSEEAQAYLRDGDVVVFMKRSKHHEENVARALMVYLPKAVLPRARRYLDQPTAAAADLALAKIVLGASTASQGVLDVFYEQHLDPACEEDMALHKIVSELDEIDLHGWLLRVLLPEYRRLGNAMHPAQPDVRCQADTAAFARWMHRVAAREPGDMTIPLSYDGSQMRVAMVFVASRERLEREGTDPYRKYAKTLIYSGKYDAVYLMGRDHNMWAVKEIIDRLGEDGRVDSSRYMEYRLRSDFASRKLNRRRAAVGCLVAHTGIAADQLADEELEEIEVERYAPADEQRETPRFFERDRREHSTTTEMPRH
jgi:hypothetical protein